MTAVTVGLPGSGAMFTSADQTGFNAAVGFLIAHGGGTMDVWPGVYSPSAEYLLFGQNISVVFEPGAIIALTGPKFTGAIVPGGSTTFWCGIFVIGAAVNISVYNLHIENQTAVDGISAVIVAGAVTNCSFYNAYAFKMTRWARFHTGYFKTSSGGVFDGGIQGVQWFAPKSMSCGTNSVPDGGGTKFANGSTSGWVQDVVEYSPEDLDCQFTSWDSNPGNPLTGKSCRNLERFGGHAVFSTAGTKACQGLFLEAAWARGNESVRIYGGKYDGQTPTAGSIGLVVGASNDVVHVEGAEFWNFVTGWQILGVGTGPETGGNITLVGLKSIRCQTGATVNLTGGKQGTIVTGLHVLDCLVDDQGSQTTTTGLQLGGNSTKQVVDFQLKGCDFSKVALTGNPVAFGTAAGPNFPEARWRDCRGLTDRGVIANPFGTIANNEIRNNGTSANPIASTNYKIVMQGASIAVVGTSATMTVQHPDGTTLGMLTTGAGPGNPSASIWYQLQGGPATLSSTNSSNGDAAIFAIGPDGTVYVNGTGTFSSVTMPSGTLITWGPWTGLTGPSVTAAGGFTPTFALLSAIASLPATLLPWGSNINFGAFGALTPAVTALQNGVSVAKPFYSYSELSVMGAAAVPVSGTSYEVRATSLIVNCSAVTSIAITDSFNQPMTSSPTSLTMVRLEPGTRIVFTFSGTPTITVAAAPD